MFRIFWEANAPPLVARLDCDHPFQRQKIIYAIFPPMNHLQQTITAKDLMNGMCLIFGSGWKSQCSFLFTSKRRKNHL